ncbi:MAG: sigma-70 family RNA polymerase sigma factor [Planctomycetota bacterium]
MATRPRTTRRLKVTVDQPVAAHAAAIATNGAARDAKATAAATEDAKLWQRYHETSSQALRDMLIERYYPLVHVIAQRMCSRLPASVQVDDLASAGVFGLLDAIDGFDPEYGVKFETYCTTRIRGAMLDEMRHLDWAPRQVRSSQARLDQTRAELEKELGRAPSDDELMDALDMSGEEFSDFRRKADAAQITSLTQGDDSDGDDSGGSPLTMVANAAAIEPGETVAVRELFPKLGSMLTPNERIILVLYYHESFTMKEIGQIQGISESRVCQIHGRIIDRLRGSLRSDQAS